MPHKNIAIFVPHAGCPHLCSFCNQRSISGTQTPPSVQEVRAICTQALSQLADPSEAEIAFFGGSFTAVEDSYRLSLLEAAQEFIGEGAFRGIRISTRPDCIDEPILAQLKRYNVTAVELGAQSMANEVLTANERGHSAEDVRHSSEMIKAYGFELGLQMMTGLYQSTPALDIYTAEELIKLSPKTVRIYPTVILEGTRLADDFRRGEYLPTETEEAVAVCAKLLRLFEESGIDVIRLGLHASETVESQRIAGAYHPAFRELCENRIFREEIKHILFGKRGNFTVEVPPGAMSKAIGQRKSNRLYFEEQGIYLKFKPSGELSGYHIRVAEEA